MLARTADDWLGRPMVRRVLGSFSVPRTPRHVERELGIGKLKMKPFVEKGLLKPLNPVARKGRLFVATGKARRLVDLPALRRGRGKDWDLIGWIKASPRQRLIILKAMDSGKRLSEDIRERASRSNPSLTRISVKGVLKELVRKGLVGTELTERKRYYWISERGRMIVGALDRVFGDGI
jgi:hypothetical protein